MSTDPIWRTRWNLGSLEYEITKKENLSVGSIIQSLCTLVEREIGQMATVEIYTHTLGDDTAFQADLTEEGRKEELYQYVKEERDLNYIEMYVTLHAYDDQGGQVKLPNGIQMDLDVYDDVDYHLLEIKINTDIFAPFYYEESSRSIAVAEKNFPLLKAFLEGVGTSFEGEWEELFILPYMYGYFCDQGFYIREEEEYD
ncbi:hypothetical protein GXN76_04800 [Kroppenstedtia pulmonis]|uniref:Uncharacterized protein n=1 Tax=Kroppenstedtia pulmonis TaxID=1380685 RepID=A0A7D3XPV3_9BACL|nr:hypothetical protein [Kroppenstedtia pulmonis]QKG83862.1 hypothetical protein GXN76_04800 [Kroppenstedtia pulmonis]